MASKRDFETALKTGRRFAAEALDRRKKAAQTRKAALASQQHMVVRKTSASGTWAIAPEVTFASQSAGVLIAEGDSWFDYPFHDVLKDLDDLYGFDVESVAHKGDTVEEMAYAGGQLDEFSRRVEKVLRSGVKPRAILLSGGGNDVAGDELAILLNHAASGIPGLNESVVAGVIDQRLSNAYVTILSAITAVCQGAGAEGVPIVVHGYDYPVPDGRGFLGGWGPLPGPWLEPGFLRKGYDAMDQRRPLIRSLIDRFNSMLKSVSRLSQFKHVRYVDLRGTLSTGADYKDWWGNELHPTAKGFEKVTARFVAVI